ncbi:MAG TPA: hypothetical protein VFA60_01550 [Terriglobales bacterium]|nr:hypothetical protein [Terriglobales bacterium]
MGFGSSARRPHAPTLTTMLLLMALACAVLPLQAQSQPQVAVVFNLQSNDLTVIDAKYRVFYNKFEKKTLPIQGYDLRGAIQDEFMTMLAADTRYKWRPAEAEDKLDAARLADEKHRTPEMVSSAKADRVLVVDVVGFGAWVTGLAKDRMEVLAYVTMLDRATGRKLWKEKIFEKVGFSGDLQKLQAEDQKEMKQGINSLIEKACQATKTKMADNKV